MRAPQRNPWRDLGRWALVATALLAACEPGETKRPDPQLQSSATEAAAADSTGAVPWAVPEQSAAQIEHAGLDVLDEEGQVLHFHTHLDVFVDGQKVTVPELGLDCCVSPVHTHSESGILHVEGDDADATYTLGNVFGLWGVRLTAECIGGYCEPESAVRIVVDGTEVTTSLPDVRLEPGAQIAVVVGEPPAVIPDRYDCSTAASIEATSCQSSFL